MFRKDVTLFLPPHGPYDCAIGLAHLCPPVGSISLSKSESEAMEKYITDSLATGIIWPSSSPLACFFLVGKEDKTPRPCMDYCGPNKITVKNKYPLPLLTSVFELLQWVTIFKKLDLHNHLVSSG